MWVAAAVAVVGAIVNFLGASAAAKNQQMVNRANVYAQKVTAEANNKVEVSRAALDNFVREQSNKKLMEKAGDQYNKIGENINRIQDSYTRGSMQKKVAAAEALGSIKASAAFAGVGGATVGMIDSTMRRVQAISQEGERKNKNLQIGDLRGDRNNQISNAVAGTNMGQTIPNLRNTVFAEPYVAKPTWMNFLSDAASMYMALGGTFGGSGGSTYTGPRIGGGGAA